MVVIADSGWSSLKAFVGGTIAILLYLNWSSRRRRR